jgi:hypothetical protein
MLWAGATAVLLALPGHVCAASAFTDQQAFTAAREELQGSSRYPWYDPKADRVRAVFVPAPTLPPRVGDRAPRPTAPRARSSRMNGFQRALIWTVLAAILASLVALLIRAALGRRGRAPDYETPANSGGDADRVERLPFPVHRTQADLLEQARQSYLAGNYGEAIVFLFSHQLVYLDRFDLVRLARGKTNRQYLHEIGARHGILRAVHETMTAFEDVFFGGRNLDRARFEQSWNRLEQFHHDVQQAAGKAMAG